VNRKQKKGYSYLQVLIFLHFPLLASFGIVGACTRVMLGEMEGEHNSEVQWVILYCTSCNIYS
jgi:hypothetical protein